MNLKNNILLLVLALAACRQMPDVPAAISPYKMDVQQGNVVTQEMVAKLKPGMTRSQVRFALGSPLIVDPFRTDRWDYVYTYQKQGRPLENWRLVVIFEDDRLLRIEGDAVPYDPTAHPPGKSAPKPAAAATEATAGNAEKPGEEQHEKGFFGRALEKLGF